MVAATIELPYTEVAPPADLAPYVDRLWLRTTLRTEPERTYRVLPDGCVDVIVHVERGVAELVGPMTRALAVPAAPAEMVAVRFKPGAAAVVTRCALAELTDAHAAADALVGNAVVGRVVEARPARDRLAVLVGWLRTRLSGAPPPDPLIAQAVARLSSPFAPLVDPLARELGVTRQHLARAFRRDVGVTPKQLARIARMQRAAIALGRGGADLARLAVELGYFDQAHFTLDVRALVGVTPAVLAAERPHTLAHLFGG